MDGEKDDKQITGSNFDAADFADEKVNDRESDNNHVKPNLSKANKLKSKKFRYIAIFFVIFLVVLVAWKFIPSKNDLENQRESQPISPQQDSEKNSGAQQDFDLSETYTNDFLRLSFKHPKSWQVSDENDVILVKSPSMSYKALDGTDKTGYFKIYIKQSATSDDGKYLGRGLVINQSEKIKYVDPPDGQRKETYLTNFGLDSTQNFAYFIVQGNFNLASGDTLGPNYASEPEAYLIAGGFGSEQTKSPMETELVSLDYFKTDNNYKTAVEILKTLQLK